MWNSLKFRHKKSHVVYRMLRQTSDDEEPEGAYTFLILHLFTLDKIALHTYKCDCVVGLTDIDNFY